MKFQKFDLRGQNSSLRKRVVEAFANKFALVSCLSEADVYHAGGIITRGEDTEGFYLMLSYDNVNTYKRFEYDTIEELLVKMDDETSAKH